MSRRRPTGEERERQALATRVMGMVEAIARTLAHIAGSRFLDDLLASGHLGAVEAAKAYDFASGTSFEGFAWLRIFGAMRDFLRKERSKLPAGLLARLDKAAAAEAGAADYIAALDERDPSTIEQEVAGAVSASVLGLLCLGDPPQNPEEAMLAEETRAHVKAGLLKLRDRDRELLSLRFFEEQTLSQIAQGYEIEVEAVRKRLKAALRRLGEQMAIWFREPVASGIVTGREAAIPP